MKYFPYKINEIGEYASLSCLGGKPSSTGNKQATRGKEKSPEIEASLEKLKKFYKTSNEKLFEMIGKVFPWSWPSLWLAQSLKVQHKILLLYKELSFILFCDIFISL